MSKTIYLANPYGFSTQQKATLLPPIISALESLGLEVWEPFARNNQVDFQQPGWAYRIGQQGLRGRCGRGWHIRSGQRRAAGRGRDG